MTLAASRPQATTADILASVRNPACTLCPLHENAHNVCIMGDGPLPARVMIVGQAPGFNEDREGIPFVGKAGQLLNEELERVGLARESVFVTNVARCYPPGDRAPTRTEMKACRPYLDAELELVKPELVVLLGNAPLQGVMGTSGITSKANAVYEKEGWPPIIPLIHPAAVLRDPTHMTSFRTGLQVVKRVLDGKNQPPETTVNLVTTDEDIEQFLAEMNDDADVLSFDVETNTTTGRKGGGLEPWAPDGRLDTIAYAWQPGVSWVLPVEHPETPDVVRRAIADIDTPLLREVGRIMALKRLVGHNGKFDLQWLRVRGINARLSFDTLIAAHLLDENRSNGLKPLSRTFLGADLYEKKVRFDIDTALDVLAEYNGRDADYTLRLYYRFRDELLANQRLARIFKYLSMPAANVLVDVELRGFPVRLRRLRDRHLEIKAQLAELEAQMLAYVPEADRSKANWNRSNFLLDFLFETLGLPVIKRTETSDQPAADEEVLLALRDKHPVVDLLMDHRHWAKQESTYTRPWIRQIQVTREARLHPSYNITGTVTGRLSSNLQQVPRDTFIRGIITAPRGYKLIEADFSQVELRVAAMITGDAGMVTAYRNGDDLHRLTAMAITGKPAEQITKAERTTAKALNFGLLYGAGWRKLQEIARADYGIVLTDDQARGYRNLFFMRYPRLAYWHESQRRLVNTLGYVESPIGRRRRLPAIRSSDKEMAAEAERQAINSPVQGFASDLTLLSMSQIEENPLIDHGLCQMIGQVHDSVLFEVADGYAEEAASLIKATMETLPVKELFGYDLPVPLVADVTITEHWGGV